MRKILAFLVGMVFATAAWAQQAATPVGPLANSFVSFINATQAQNTTAYDMIGASGNGTTAIAMQVPSATTFRNFRVSTTNAPAAGQTFTFTVFTGSTLGSLTSSGITCQISNPATTCNDLTNSKTLTAGQYWLIQAITSATSGATGLHSYSIQTYGQ